MATSGTFTGGRGGDSNGPWLTLEWNRIDEDIANNRSLLRLTLRLHSEYSLYFSASKSGNLEGQSFTYTGNWSGSGTKTIKTRDIWVNHDSDGSKSIYLNATFDIAVNWAGNWVSSLSVGGTAYIDTIPRTSDFSISGNTLGSAITVSINRASSAFTHTVIYDLPSGDRRADWGGVSTSHTFTPSLADAQYIPNSTSGTAKIVVQTYHGSTYIGSKARTFTMYVPSSVKPTASGLGVSIYGSGRDKTLGMYIQSISRVTASFTRSTMYGATISSSHITIRRASDNANSQTINGNSGTTGNNVSLSGTYEAIAYVKDSRGRTDTQTITFTVHAYSPPKISSFSTSRSSIVSTNVNANVVASWTVMGSSNPTDISIVGTNNLGTNQTLYTLTNSIAGSINTNQSYPGQSDASSFTYLMTVTDSFGNKATAASKIGTSFVELTISKGKGIGVGKVHERGSMDIAGEVFLDGTIHMPINSYRSTSNGGGLDANNGDIYGLNGIWFGGDGGDTANNGGEGLIFPRDDTPNDSRDYSEWDNFRINNGVGYLNGRPVVSSENETLWLGAKYPVDGDEIVPSRRLSECPHGWVLIWSDFNSPDPMSYHQYQHVISRVGLTGGVNNLVLAFSGGVESIIYKALDVYDDKIVGTGGYNSRYNDAVLRAVIGF